MSLFIRTIGIARATTKIGLAAVPLAPLIASIGRSLTARPILASHQSENAVLGGLQVLMFLGGANRDPRRWARQDEYDISRRTISRLSFGSGIHQCVGSLLARLEGERMLIPSIGEMRDIKERYARGRD